MVAVDLNADVGEECGDDAALFAVVTSANVAAGGHAGGGAVLEETIRLAATHGVAVGAHPSYPDRPGFGRASRLDEHGSAGIRTFIREQVAVVLAECRRQGVSMTHVKAHGALYADVGRDPLTADALLAGIADALAEERAGDLPVMGASGSALDHACRRSGVPFLAEVFADRGYAPTGALMPRSAPGAVIHDPEVVAARAVRMVLHEQVEAADGSLIRVVGDTVCLHGDTPGAVLIARAVRDSLTAAGVTVARHDIQRRQRADG